MPEVETIRSGLSNLIVGKTVKAVAFDWPKSFPNSPMEVDKFLVNATVLSVQRRGKALLLALNSGYSLVIHLKMTGQLVYRDKIQKFGAGHPTGSLIGELPDKSTRVTLEFKDNAKLFFNDQRKFGWVRLMPTVEVMNLNFFKKIGPEPLEPAFTWGALKTQLQRRPNTSIKAALLDQSVVAGIGNIYADESLWGAKLHPAAMVKTLTDKNIRLLYKSIIDVLSLSIALGGSTDRNYVDAEGKKGNYLKFANVFRRDNLPCPRCGTTIIKLRVAGRGTHICPKEQRLKL